MNPNLETRSQTRTTAAFTLIELLVVIAVIGVLAGLIFPITKGLKTTRIKRVASAELSQMETAIQNYKSKLGYFPPDNPAGTLTTTVPNQIFFELGGATVDNATSTFISLNGKDRITLANLGTATGSAVTGIANSSTSAGGTDDKAGPLDFLKDSQLKPGQVADWTVNGVNLRSLVCSAGWTGSIASSPSGSTLTPWQYRSTSPVNNRGTFDLWVDIYLDGKTNRFSNWSKTPQIVP
ncbi:MAG: type II secretion system protein [Opitutaceae bacterium]|nr:type II secretion system protein [Verrucomicrobiales bacterium]